jgi:hypothetical protein
VPDYGASYPEPSRGREGSNTNSCERSLANTEAAESEQGETVEMNNGDVKDASNDIPFALIAHIDTTVSQLHNILHYVLSEAAKIMQSEDWYVEKIARRGRAVYCYVGLLHV